MSTAAIPVLRIPRTDVENQFILLQPQPQTPRSTTPSTLDVKLLATEGENAYGIRLKHPRIPKLIQKAFTGTNEELATILCSLLFPHLADDKVREHVEGIALSATIENTNITLVVRKSVGGIKQRIAALDIPQTEDEIGLFDWAGEACNARDRAEERLRAADKRLEQQQDEIEKLLGQLNHLVALKQEHEGKLLVKFQALLNSKKQHIRKLTQLLDEDRTAKPSVISEPEPEPEPEAKPAKRATGKGKGKGKLPAKQRNARAKAPAKRPNEDEESDGGFQRMDLDHQTENQIEHMEDEEHEHEHEKEQESDARTTEEEVEAETPGETADRRAKNVGKAKAKPQPRSSGRKVKEKMASRPLAASDPEGARSAVMTTIGRKRGATEAPGRSLPMVPADGEKNNKGHYNGAFADDSDTEDEDEL